MDEFLMRMLMQMGGTNPFLQSPTAAYNNMPMGGGISDVPPLAMLGSLGNSQQMMAPFSMPNIGLLPETNLDEFRKGGVSQFPRGGLGTIIPNSFHSNTFNNTPSNIPGGPGGGFQFVNQMQFPAFSSTMFQPFDPPTHDSRLIHPNHMFPKGGKLARLEKRQARLERKGKTDTGRYGRITDQINAINQFQSLKDQGFSFNMENPNTGQIGITNPFGQSSSYQLPERGFSAFGTGLGSAAQGLAGTFGSLLSPGIGQVAALGSMFGGNPSAGLPQFNAGMFGGLGQFGATPGIAGTMQTPGFDLSSLFGRIPGLSPNSGLTSFQFKKGGQVSANELIPIQAEKVGNLAEKLVHLDGAITDTNATTRHKYMDDDEPTDLVPPGTYVLSADKSMRIHRKTLDDIFMGWKVTPYSEIKKGKLPEEIMFSEILPRKGKRFTPAELGDRIKKKFKVVDHDVMDVFMEKTNKENLASRLPYLSTVIMLNEDKKGVDKFPKGGSVPKAPDGGFLDTLGNIGSIASSFAPFLSSIFGGGGGQGMDPTSNALMSASFPLNTIGSFQNVNAQRNALNRAQGNLGNLTSDLMNINQLNTGLGALAFSNLETNAPLLNYDTSRLENFNTRTPSNFVDALSTPNYDINSIIDRLGRRGSAPIVSNLISSNQAQRNQAAITQFNQDRGLSYDLANRLTGIGIDEATRNQGIQAGNMRNRNDQLLGFTGQLQSGLGQRGEILSNAFSVGTGFDLQKAGLAGQVSRQAAQDALNLASLRSTLLNSANGGGGQGQGGGNSFNGTSQLPRLQSLSRGFSFPSVQPPSLTNPGTGLNLMNPTTPNLSILNGLQGLTIPGFGGSNLPSQSQSTLGPLGIPIIY